MTNQVESVQTKMANSLRATLDLMEFSILLMRQNIARQLPGCSQEHIDAELYRWLIVQPSKFVVQK